ncbi:MAG TPA: hypothetical protein VKA69_03260 [Desulfobacteria bacterium]|nr:hypothetical protein [Desulfobacteria bacterium]
MRNLLYVPVIHEAADLGSISSAADEKGQNVFGPIRWERHKEIVKSFWKQISHYFEDIDAAGLEIFQDGLPVGGEIGLKIIREGARRGSRNYGIVLDLINRGGVIKKTEDVELLQKELIRTKQLSGKDAHGKEELDAFQDLTSGEQLMADRDHFVAQTINETLEHRGVLFMGAYHHVPVSLDKDIEIVELKKIDKVQAYLKILYSEGPREVLAALSAYMVSPIHTSPLQRP